MIYLQLPWPPSVNGRLGHSRTNKRMFLTAKYRQYLADATLIIKSQWIGCKAINEPVDQIITFHPPDKRTRDNDNYTKAVNDAIKYAKVIEDDSLLRDTLIRWREPQKHGCVIVILANIKFTFEELLA